LSLEQLMKKAFFYLFVSPFLHQEINGIPVLIHGSPQVNFLSTDCDELHQDTSSPQVATLFLQITGIFRSKPSTPLPN